jgi:hypothetical protein
MPAKVVMDVGSKFSRLEVLENLPSDGSGLSKCRVICECGNSLIVSNKSLKSGNTKSCGCLKLEALVGRSTKHGMSRTRFYKIWLHMKERCNDQNSQYYRYYGGRGISYDPRWETFQNFRDDMVSTYQDNLELDRIDPNGNYCKDNCQWSTESHQAYNQRLRVTNTSGKTGVYQKEDGKFWAEIQNNGKTEWLGTFETFQEAKKVRELKEVEYYGFIKD